MSKMLLSAQMEEEFEWRKWWSEIPSISFPPGWRVAILPPIVGAIVRFIARKGNKEVSVYLDCYDLLGHFGGPYWEAYRIGDDTARFAMNDVEGLIKCIDEELSKA